MEENHKYEMFDVSFNTPQHWCVKFSGVGDQKQTLMAMCDSNMAPHMHVTVNGDKIVIGHYNPKSNKWEHKHQKREDVMDENCEIELLFDEKYVYLYINDSLIIFWFQSFFENVNQLIIGVPPQMQGDKYYLGPETNFVVDKHSKTTVHDEPIISIILNICNTDYGHHLNTINAIHNIHKYTNCAYEIIVFDDNSSCSYTQDWLSDIIVSMQENIRFITNTEQHGIIRGRNLAAEEAVGQYIVFFDNDQFVQPGWDDVYLYALESNKKVVVGSEHWKHHPLYYISYNAHNEKIDELSYINGGGLAISAANFILLGGFSKEFTMMYCEDSDFCWHAKENHNFSLEYVEGAVSHLDTSTISEMNQSHQWFIENNMKLIDKYRDKFNFVEKGTEKPSILFLVNSTGIGGAENALSNILSTSRYQKHVLVMKKIDSWIKEVCEDLSDSFFCIGSSNVAQKILFYVYINKINTVVFNNFNYNCKIEVNKILNEQLDFQVKIVDVICDNWYWEQLFKVCRDKKEFDEYLSGIDVFICKNRNMLEQLHERGLYNSKLIVNGVSESKLSSKAMSNKAEANGKFIIGTVSRISKEKRIEIILKVAAEIGKKFQDIEFRIIGSASETQNAYHQQLLDDAQELSNVVFLGELDKSQVQQELQNMDLFIFTSKEEGCPNVILEAMSFGVPTIALDVVGVQEVVVDQKTGYLISDNSQKIDVFVDKISRLFQQKNLLLQMQSDSIEFAKNQFSIEKMVDSYADVVLPSVPDNNKIAIVVPTIGVGGAEKIAIEQAVYFNSVGLSAKLFYYLDYPNKLKHDYDFICSRVGIKNPLDAIITQCLMEGYGVVITHLVPNAMTEAYKDKINIINTLHSPTFLRSIDYELLKNDESVIYHCLSNFMYSATAPYIMNNRKFIVPYGVDTNNEKHFDKMSIRNSLGIHEDSFVVGSIAKNSDVKNISHMIGIFKELQQKIDDIKLLLIGSMDLELDGYENVLPLIDNDDAIISVGSQECVDPYLSTIDCYLCTSWSEGLPISILEALALGIPCVSNNVGGINEIITHGVNGYLVNISTDNTNDFVGFVSQVYGDKIDRNICIQSVVDKFDFNTNMDKYVVSLQGLLGDNNETRQ